MAKKNQAGENLVRITSVVVLGGVAYQPNDLVSDIPEGDLKELIDTGKALDSEANINYCLNEIGVKPVKCGEPRSASESASSDDEALSE